MNFYALSELVDQDQLRAFLSTDINYAAYAIGDLEPPYSEHAKWIAASRTGGIEGLALVYAALDPQALFLMGELPALSALLLQDIGASRVFFTARPEAEHVLRAYYRLEHLYPMFRMRVNKGLFKPLDNADAHHSKTIALTASNLDDIKELIEHAAAQDERDISDIAFDSNMVEDGYYRGMYRGSQLVALGGTHLVARQARMAAVGNIVVHPDHRRQGLGGLVSHAVTATLVNDGFELIVLNVRQNNQGALKIYRKLGYKQVCLFIEGLAVRA